MPRSNRPDYIQRKIDLRRQQAEHRKSARPGCICPLCLPRGRVIQIILARNKAERAKIGEPPF